MTISELYKQVAQLGFEDSLEDNDRFFYAANSALLQVNKLRPAIGNYLINHKPLENLVTESTFSSIEKLEDLTFEATDSKSYYFEADGNGFAYIEKYNGEADEWSIFSTINLSSTGAFVAYKGFIKEGGNFVSGNIRIRFTGDYIYNVRNVALYRHLFSDNANDIPAFQSYTRYDMKDLVDDFLALCCPPIQEDAKNRVLNQEYEIEGNSVILIPYGNKGEYKVLYERNPARLEVQEDSVEESETEIDLDEELCTLLPILIAAYVWIDDEPEKSQYYMNLYRERAADIERKTKYTAPVIIKSSNGW